MFIVWRGRFWYRVMRELSKKYKLALIFGFSIGLIGSITLFQFFPKNMYRWFLPVQRIGIIGEFTPTTLPLSIQKQISFGLTTLAPDGSVSPGLALSWEATQSGKLTKYKFHLRPDVYWHNGKRVQAQDVNYNIRDVTFSVINSSLLEATLKEQYSPFLTLLSKPILMARLEGFAAYKVSNIRLKGDSVQYLRLVPFRESVHNIIEYRFYQTEAMAITAFKRGDIDNLQELSNPRDLVRWGKSQIKEHVRYDRIVTLFFNTKNPKLSEKSFRQALSYGVPKINQEPAWSPISKTSWAYANNVRHYEYDESQTKKLLEKSAIASKSASLTITTFAPYLEFVQAIAQSWTNLGVPTGVKVANDLSDGFEVLLSAQNVPPDPDQYPFWHQTQVQTNITGYSNVKIDKLLEDGRREMDIVKRKIIYADFAKRLVEDDPATFLYYPKTYEITRQR